MFFFILAILYPKWLTEKNISTLIYDVINNEVQPNEANETFPIPMTEAVLWSSENHLLGDLFLFFQ